MKPLTHEPRRSPLWWTVPNLVTVIRFVLIAPVSALLLTGTQPLAAAGLTAVFGATDWVDGFLARRLGQVSRAGEMLDPLADRVGITCIAVALAVAGAAPWYVLTVFPVVDLVVSAVYLVRGRGRRLKVTRIGKIRTGLAMSGLFVVMLGMGPGLDRLSAIGQAGLAVAALLHIAVGAGYVRRWLR